MCKAGGSGRRVAVVIGSGSVKCAAALGLINRRDYVDGFVSASASAPRRRNCHTCCD